MRLLRLFLNVPYAIRVLLRTAVEVAFAGRKPHSRLLAAIAARDSRGPSRTSLSKPRIQYGAIPFRIADGQVEVLLATSRETKRWIIPKGWPMKGKSAHRTAAREAFEEAGVVGKIQHRAIGSYLYEKRMKDGAIVLCEVTVFPLRVEEQRRRWPEYNQRETRWFEATDAAATVQEPELAVLIGKLHAGLQLQAA